MPAVVQRMIVPANGGIPFIEWLVAERPPEWRRDGDAAIPFPSHAEADRKAVELRAAGVEGSIFAAIRPLRHQPELPLGGGVSFSHAASPMAAAMRPRDWHKGKPNCGVE